MGDNSKKSDIFKNKKTKSVKKFKVLTILVYYLNNKKNFPTNTK